MRALQRQLHVNAYPLAMLFRIGLIAWGHLQDERFSVRYTDVDYDVLTDAAVLMVGGGSPYGRATYRYTPLLAWLMVPNVLVHPACGKVLFALADLAVGAAIEGFLVAQGVPRGRARTCAAALWLFNPVVANVSTRGSCDSLTSMLVLLAARATTGQSGKVMRDAALAALPLGLAVHIRLYPVIYAPAFALALGARWRQARGGGQLQKGVAGFTLGVLRDGLSPPALVFAAVAAASVVSACAAAAHGYGHEYVEHALLYHASRTDNRHNFSMHFYWIYLDYESDGRRLLGLAAFVPQALLVVAAALVHARTSLALCLFMQTAVFVACNKVCTGQYFIWYMAVLPLLAPSLGLFAQRPPEQDLALRRVLAAGVAWSLALALWLLQAYRLEFLGVNTFASLWMASVALFLTNMGVLVAVLRACCAAPLQQEAYSPCSSAAVTPG